MSEYLFIQSQEPYTEARANHQYALASALRAAGHGVTVLLVQNGVIPARRQARCAAFEALLGSGVRVCADQLSLQQREIDRAELKDGVTVGDVGAAVDAMLAGHKVIWH
jgi:predicted peroxiredoxin